VNKFFIIFFIFILLQNCSLNDNSKFWNEDSKKVESKKKSKTLKFLNDKNLESEQNPNLTLNFKRQVSFDNERYKLNNNSGNYSFDGNLEIQSKYKFSKIDKLINYEPKIISSRDDLVFFEKKGAIFKLDKELKLLWKKNFYTKSEKKIRPILRLNIKDNIIIVADNISKYYALDLNSGDLIWMRRNDAPFNSEIKFYKNSFLVVDYNNVLRCFDIKNGNEKWNLKTDNNFIKSNKVLSMVIIQDKVFFSNSLGDISAVDVRNGDLLWQLPTQNSLLFDNSFTLRTSSLIADDFNLYFSNNRNQFFSINTKNGTLNWRKKINSDITPISIDNYLFTISIAGSLIILDKNNGKVVKSKKILNTESKNRNILKPVGFKIGLNKIYISLDNGRIFIVDLKSGNQLTKIKIGSRKISEPFIINKNLYVLKNNSIIKLR